MNLLNIKQTADDRVKAELEAEIESLKKRVEQQQIESDKAKKLADSLAAEKARMIEQHEAALAKAQQVEEERLEVWRMQLRKESELGLSSRARKLRPQAYEINERIDDVVKLIARFRESLAEIYPNEYELRKHINFDISTLPYVQHREGSPDFTLTIRKECK